MVLVWDTLDLTWNGRFLSQSVELGLTRCRHDHVAAQPNVGKEPEKYVNGEWRTRTVGHTSTQ